MKNRYILLLCLLLIGCDSNVLDKISDHINLDIRNGNLITYEDSHGWMGDGETYAEVSFDNNEIENSIKNNILWNKLPLEVDIEIFLYGNEEKNSMLIDESGKCLLPKINNGYYFFKDQQGSEESLSDRSSYNLTISIYDSEIRKLYYIEIDT